MIFDACQVAPPLIDKRATANPEIASEPFAEIATGKVLNQPFEPVAAGTTRFADGFEVSSFQLVEPVADNPLVVATT